jgi:tryptophan synthase alpha chain
MLSNQNVSRRSIGQTFDSLRERKRIGLVPFVPAGFPDLATTIAVIKAMDGAGASVIEVGFPFSDPVADGPTIQEAFTAALAKKIKVAEIFATIRGISGQIAAPMVPMVSYSIVFRYGVKRFLADAKGAGFGGLIIPDLPPPEAEKVCEQIRGAGLDTILLVAPTTSPDRRKDVARLSSGFVYYLSVSGITGERDQLPGDLGANVRELWQMTEKPICVGFGISKPKHIKDLTVIADGAIVGSAIVKQMKQALSGGPEAIAAAVGRYCSELMTEVGE